MNDHPSGLTCDEMYDKLRQLDSKCERLEREHKKNVASIEKYNSLIIKLRDLVQEYYPVDYESGDTSNEIWMDNLYEKTKELLIKKVN